jgi:hypothetical protein
MCYGLCKCSRFLVHYHSYAATLVFRLLCTKIFCQLGGQHVPTKAREAGATDGMNYGADCRSHTLQYGIAEAILCNMAFRMVLLLSSMCYQVISCAEHSVFKPLKIHYKSIFQYSVCRNSMLFCPSRVHMKEKSLEAMLENG